MFKHGQQSGDCQVEVGKGDQMIRENNAINIKSKINKDRN